MLKRNEIREEVGTVSLGSYDSWEGNELISILQKLKNKCKHKCRMEIKADYGYYNDVSYSLVVYNTRLETDQEYKVRTAKEKEEHKKWKMEEIERAKEVLRKAGVKEV